MKVLIFGKTGQLAQELVAQAGDITVEVRGRQDADFTAPEACARWIDTTDADAIINAVAYTAVDQAEAEEDRAHAINATTPTRLAEAAAQRGLPFIHVSTDYVFDGAGSNPFQPDDPTGPLGAYGRTKLAGEDGIRAVGGTYAILRTSWVFSAHGQNFVKTMLRLGAERPALNIVADQIGGPTPARDIARACLSIARALTNDPGVSGTYHFSGTPDVSWADFAQNIFEQAGLDVAVGRIGTADYPTPATRPLNSRLDCRATQRVFGVPQPDWRAGLRDVLTDLAVADGTA